jgi:hypothetical protein
VTHWFLSFLFRRPGESHWHPEDATTVGEHPVDYILRARSVYRDQGYEYRLLFFHAIPDEVYRRANPEIDGPPPVVGAIPRQTVR